MDTIEMKKLGSKELNISAKDTMKIRVYCSTGRHHSTNEFGHGNDASNEFQIYIWQGAILQE